MMQGGIEIFKERSVDNHPSLSLSLFLSRGIKISSDYLPSPLVLRPRRTKSRRAERRLSNALNLSSAPWSNRRARARSLTPCDRHRLCVWWRAASRLRHTWKGLYAPLLPLARTYRRVCANLPCRYRRHRPSHPLRTRHPLVVGPGVHALGTRRVCASARARGARLIPW